MKKIQTLLLLLTLTGCADTVHLGYPGEHYPPKSKKEIVVQYGIIPTNCRQIGLTILPSDNELEDLVEDLRDEAAEIGGNYVNIENINYGYSSLVTAAKQTIGTIYLCHPLKNK